MSDATCPQRTPATDVCPGANSTACAAKYPDDGVHCVGCHGLFNHAAIAGCTAILTKRSLWQSCRRCTCRALASSLRGTLMYWTICHSPQHRNGRTDENLLCARRSVQTVNSWISKIIAPYLITSSVSRIWAAEGQQMLDKDPSKVRSCIC